MRKHVVWVLALSAAIAVAVAGIATGADNTQTINAAISPSKLPKQKTKGAAINVLTTTGDGNNDGEIDQAHRAEISFDDDIVFKTKGVAQCAKNQIDPPSQPLSTQEAKAKCPKAVVGSGQAQVALAGIPGAEPCPQPNCAVVTAFNGKPQGGKPVILLHSYVESLGQSTTLVGVLKGASGDFGTKLDVTIEPLPGDTAITRFQTRVKKTFMFRGRRTNYVNARCHDGNRTLNFRGKFSFDEDDPDQAIDYSKTANDTQKCTVAR